MRRVALSATLAPLALALACSSTDESSLSSGGEPEKDAGAETSTSTPRLDASTSPDVAPADAGPTYTGEATYYVANGTGACGFPASPNDLMVAAMNKSQYSKSTCGRCILVVGPKGTVKARIVDLCPGCGAGDVDLSAEAFAKISTLSAGRVKISWTFVPC